mmetsp:Transcript_16799/g.26801  ORF Transcript_16799/g.26801 Transcript_16799/m.26801 type:complete len:122 (+) Transcript_16799:704-1069(+)
MYVERGRSSFSSFPMYLEFLRAKARVSLVGCEAGAAAGYMQCLPSPKFRTMFATIAISIIIIIIILMTFCPSLSSEQARFLVLAPPHHSSPKRNLLRNAQDNSLRYRRSSIRSHSAYMLQQ